MNHKTISFLLIVSLTMLFCASTEAQQDSGVTNYLYTPHISNFDNLKDKGDIFFQISSAALTNIDFPSARLAYSPFKNIGIGINYFSFSSSFNSIRAQETDAYIVSGELSYLSDVVLGERSLFRWQADFGYGAGKLRRSYQNNNTGEAMLGIQRIKLAASGMFEIDFFGIGLGLSGSYFNYSNIGAFGEVSQTEVERLDYLLSVAPAFLIDLNTRFEFGGEVAKLFFSWDFTLRGFENENDNITDYLNNESIHLGFYILINKAINKIKIKRK